MPNPRNNLEDLYLDDVQILGHRRLLDEDSVSTLAKSIERIGLQSPITVRKVDDYPWPEGPGFAYVLVAGAHRLEALKRLKIEPFRAAVMDWDSDTARMWEIAENLHRAELTQLERSEHIAEWIKLADKPGQVDQVSKGGRGKKGGISKASFGIGVQRKDAERSLQVAGLTDEAKDAAKAVGLDDNRTALLKAAKEDTPEKQTAKIHEIANAKAVKAPRATRSKIDPDVKDRAAHEVAEMIAEYVPGGAWDALKSNLYAAGAANIANALTNITGQSIMDRRHA
jgi:hypothetical protein